MLDPYYQPKKRSNDKFYRNKSLFFSTTKSKKCCKKSLLPIRPSLNKRVSTHLK